MIKLYMGKIGVGKSTALALEARKYMKKGIKVYSNFHLLGAYKIDPYNLGKYNFENCAIFIDEAQIVFNNRDYRNTPKHIFDFIALSRHYNCDIHFASQSWEDLDVKIRRQAHRIYIVQPTILFFAIKLQLVRLNFGLNEDSTDIVTKYRMSLLDTRYKLKRPAWKYFDSFERINYPKLPSGMKWGTKPLEFIDKLKLKLNHLLKNS